MTLIASQTKEVMAHITLITIFIIDSLASWNLWLLTLVTLGNQVTLTLQALVWITLSTLIIQCVTCQTVIVTQVKVEAWQTVLTGVHFIISNINGGIVAWAIDE